MPGSRITHFRLFMCLALVLATLAGCQRVTPSAAQTLSGTLKVGETERSFRLYIPSGYDPFVSWPLVINLHGMGSNAAEQEALSGMSQQAEQSRFIVVYPDGEDNYWRAGPASPDITYIRELVAYLQTQYNLDEHRIYATGFSNGGGMANRLACEAADLIAAAAPVAGAFNFWQDCAPSRPISLMAFHGLNDQSVPYEGLSPEEITPPILVWAAAWAERDGCASELQASLYVDGVTENSWADCPGGVEIHLLTLENHDHSWPGSNLVPGVMTSQAIDANEVMWKFFAENPRP